MTSSPNTPESKFDKLINKTWEDGMVKDDLKYQTSKSVVSEDQGIPFEARYIPSLAEKNKESGDADEDDNEDGKEKKHQDDQTSRGNERLEKSANKSIVDDVDDDEEPPLQGIDRSQTDAAEEVGINTRDDSHGDVADDYEPPEIDPADDPFAPPRKNVITSIPPEYTCMLNKYSLEQGHFLVVTNEFVPQYGPVRPQDLVMLHDVVQRPAKRTYAFLNGGPDAGASQEHRHFQFMEVPDFDQPVWPDAIYQANPEATKPQSHPDLPVAHFLLPISDTSQEGLLKTYNAIYAEAQKAAKTTDEKMPFNFLMMKEYMMILPRANNTWHEDIGIGGTCMVGTFPVEDPKLSDVVKETGIIKIFQHIGFAK